jgi:uncharacterized damage-inducible protein DinB
MTDELDSLRAVLVTTAPRWLSLTQTLGDDLLNRQPAAGEWSAMECLLHLLDTEHIFPARLQALLAGQPVPAFDPHTQGSKNPAVAPAHMASEFAGLRQASLATLERVTFQDLKRSGQHSELGTVSVGQLLHEWAAHDLNHTIQAERAIMQPFIQGCGPWRFYFQELDVS